MSICTFSIKVTDDHASTGPASVTTFFTIQVSVDFGKADIHAYPNTWPIISMLRADLVFHPDTSLQAWTFNLTATDPDSDNMHIVWHSSCEINGGTWTYPTITTPQFNVFDSVDSCNFTVTVTDLCTNGDCGASIAAQPAPLPTVNPAAVRSPVRSTATCRRWPNRLRSLP